MALNDPIEGSNPVVAKVTIRAREFRPSTVTIPVDREVRLIIENEDVELHAFAPSGFLEDIPLQTDGNGAAQFGEHGLIRILIPSGGRAELRFTLSRAGLYNYRCDLPGHQMRAQIQVEEQSLPVSP
jgi:plastocyanin